MHLMGLSSGNDLEMKEAMVVQLKDESRESIHNLTMENVGITCFDLEPEFEFWPVQHPTEPSHEDRPVECPMPHSSHLISDDRMQDDRFLYRKRPGAKTVECTALKAIEPPIRTVRKRHHDHTKTITPLLQTLPLHPHLHQKER